MPDYRKPENDGELPDGFALWGRGVTYSALFTGSGDGAPLHTWIQRQAWWCCWKT